MLTTAVSLRLRVPSRRKMSRSDELNRIKQNIGRLERIKHKMQNPRERDTHVRRDRAYLMTEVERLQVIIAKCYDHLDGCSHGCDEGLFDECETEWYKVQTEKKEPDKPVEGETDGTESIGG